MPISQPLGNMDKEGELVSNKTFFEEGGRMGEESLEDFSPCRLYSRSLLGFSKKARNAKKILEITKQSHKAQVDAINKSHAEVLKKRDENLKKYQEIMRQLEQEHAERREAISSDKKKRVKQIVEDSGDDPQKLAEMLKDTFGFEINND